MNTKKNFITFKAKEAPKLFSVLLDQLMMSVTTLLTTIVLARTYEKQDYAEIVLLFSISLFILGFQSAIVSRPFAINLNDFLSERENYYRYNVGFKVLFTALVILVFPILYFLLFDKFDLKNVMVYGFYVVAYSSYFFIREMMLGERKTKENLMYGMACSVGLLVLLTFVFYSKSNDIFVFLVGAAIIYVSLSGFHLVRNRTSLNYSRQKGWVFFNKNWRVGKWLVGSNFFFHVSSNIYPWLLLYITTKSNIAIYGVLMSVANIMTPVLTAFGAYLLPLFVKRNNNYKAIDSMVKKWSLLFGASAVLLVFLGYFFGNRIIVLLYGNGYANLGLLVLMPFLVQGLNILFQPLKISLNAIKRTDVNFWVLIPRSIIAVVLGYILVKKYGLPGVFYTMIIENIVYQGIQFLIYLRILKKRR